MQRTVIFFAAAMVFVAPANAERWVSQSTGDFGFITAYEGESLRGAFQEFTVDYLPGESLGVTVRLTAADMGDADMNEVLKGAEWFDVASFATATYTATRFRSLENGTLIAEGELSLKGITAPLEVPLMLTSNGNAGRLAGSVVLDRTRFNVGEGDWSTGTFFPLNVEVEFNVAVQKQP
jgi:polyisoprenoid-binding protein YceI